MTMRRFNAWLNCFAKSEEYGLLLYFGWLAVAACVPFALIRPLLIAEGLC